MNFDTAMEGQQVSIQEARRELKSHGIQCKMEGQSLMVLDDFDGWIEMELKSDVILEWLGY